ncbi:MAG: DNA-3-methyladenine glycosylase I [Betaproteobacteria bacterium]|nr:MAG: DNA-3-methyladenine glycosylase I [Betaproteobacteria bacterium]
MAGRNQWRLWTPPPCSARRAPDRVSLPRCQWVPAGNELYTAYHDFEWGVPVHDERLLFEYLILEGAQAGLSWSTILNKREGYRRAFAGFDPRAVSALGTRDVERLMADPGIVRNRAKIQSTISNAGRFLEVQAEFGSFDTYVWGFVDGSPIQNAWQRADQVPVSTIESDALSKDLKRRGFKFVGTTIIYAFMQAIGMVNDHSRECFRWRELQT